MDRRQLEKTVIAAQQGDQNALNQLITECYNEIYYYALHCSKEPNAAEDITQEAIIVILNKLSSLQKPGAFMEWAKTIVKHIVSAQLRQQRYEIPLPEDMDLEEIVEPNIYVDPSEAMDRADLNDTLVTFLNKLPEHQRKVMRMRYFDEMTVEQIAQAEGITKSVAQSRLLAAQKEMRRYIQEYGTSYGISPSSNPQELMGDILISYAFKDFPLAAEISKQLKKQNLNVSLERSDSPDCRDYVTKALNKSRVFIPLITKSCITTFAYRQELLNSLSLTRQRAKEAIVICYAPDSLAQWPQVHQPLKQYPMLVPTGADSESIKQLCSQISGIIQGKKLDNVLFETLSEYIHSGLNDNATNILCQLIRQLCIQIRQADPRTQLQSYITLLSYLEKMTQLYTYEYNDSTRELTAQKLEALDDVSQLLSRDAFWEHDLYCLSIAIRLVYLDWLNRLDCADTMAHTEGTQQSTGILSEQQYIQKQSVLISQYRSLLEQAESYPDVQKQFILTTEQYIRTKVEKKSAPATAPTDSTQEDELLQSVAAFTREGNKLFDIISEQQPAKEFLQCLITSYERLKSYSDLVGAKQICAECIDRIAELKNKIIDTREQITATQKSETGIKALLGLTIPNSGKFDVFLSHKKEDYDIALKIYEFLRQNLKAAFLDSQTLPEMSKAEYSDAIDSALEGSQHFVVVLSDLSYLESRWLKYEMSCFHNEIKEGRKPNGNFLFVVTDDVYEQIISSNKQILKLAYRRYEIIRLSDYTNVLLSYLPS